MWIRLAATQPLYFPPGSGYHYSNIGFEVLGLVLEQATGQPLEAVYRQRIIQPLGLDHTAYDPQGEITGPHARGYLVHADGSLADMTAVHLGIGAEGGIVSDAADTARFLTALMQGQLLGPAAAAAMRTGDFWTEADTPSCGGSAFGHSGGGEGYKTNVWVSADGHRVVVLLLNGRMADMAPATSGPPGPWTSCTARPDQGLATRPIGGGRGAEWRYRTGGARLESR
ncbi:MAG TPA: serine hydrolase domain-containing protein [Actinomycetota bacterium]|nr:serine hydrolase domain-containing protein [Actinomycetota bacterium]